ncbi:MAG: hypothetical protein ACKOPN_12175, partial [Prochlorococcaceae cyanobacterium]
YGPGGLAGLRALPGDGGYQLHAHRLVLERPDGATVEFTAPPEQWMVAPPSGRQQPQVSTAVDRQRS